MKYAKSHGIFSKREISLDLSKETALSKTALSWYLSVLTKRQQLARIGHGIYTIANKNFFAPIPSKDIRIIYTKLKKKLPFANFCLYDGSIIAPLQHHISPNHIIYIETNREATETVFNTLKDEKKSIFLKPSKNLIYNYVNMNEQAYIIKQMVTEAPLQIIQDIPSPTLEKLLVDIRIDSDFFYLKGQESNYILENAFILYHINENRLLRYASRRGIKNEMYLQIEKLKAK